MFKKVAGLTLLFSLVLISSSEQKECFSAGECKESLPISGTVTDNQYECRKKCQSWASCNWFTYFTATSYCQLYKNCVQLDNSSCKECLSGEKECIVPELKCWVTGQCKEEPKTVTNATNAEGCLEACQLEPECGWFTFNSADSSCSFFKACEDLVGCDSCTTGESKCKFSSRESEWHLVIGGAGSPNTVELFNWHTSQQCQLPNLPVAVIGHVAASMDGVPVFCEAGVTRRACFKMDKTKRKWVSISSLLAGVEFGKSIYVPSQGWIVFGRLGNNLKKVQQLTSLEAQWKEGPDLLVESDAYKTGSCIFQIDETKTGHIDYRAGSINSWSHNNYRSQSSGFFSILDWSTMTYTMTEVTSRNSLRTHQSCAVLKAKDQSIQLAMTSGTTKFGLSMINLDTRTGSNVWIEPPSKLPMEIGQQEGLGFGQLLAINNGTELLLYGGQIQDKIFDGIYKFFPASNTWMRVGKMLFPRAAHVVIPVHGLSCP